MGFEEMREGGVGKSVQRRGDEFKMLSEVKERVCKILQLLVKEEMLNAAVSRANSLEEQLSATKKVNNKLYQVAVQTISIDDDDDDGYNVDGNEPIPMYVKHIEAMLDEIDLMEEVEMEDAVVEPVSVPAPDIDSADSKNPLAVVDYIDDIYEHYWNTEDFYLEEELLAYIDKKKNKKKFFGM